METYQESVDIERRKDCSYFTPPFYPKRGNKSWNYKDQHGFRMLLGFVLILILVVITLCSVKRAHPAVLGVLTLFIFSVVSIFAWNARLDTPLFMAGSLIAGTIRTPPVLDPSEIFSGSSEFERHHLSLKDEIVGFVNNSNVPFTRTSYAGRNTEIGSDSNPGGDAWRVLTVYACGEMVAGTDKNFPILCGLITQFKDEIGSCAVSILPGKTMIPQHVGYFKGIIRYMLAIEVPLQRERCYICVNDQKLVWEEGKSVAFDDTFPHKVFNDTDERRIVIYMDIFRKPKSEFLRRAYARIWNGALSKMPIWKDEKRKNERLQSLHEGYLSRPIPKTGEP